MSAQIISSEELSRLSERFEDRTPQERLQWGYEQFGDRAVMGTGFGSSGVALASILSDVRPGSTIFFLDTDLLYPETYELKDALAERLDVEIERVHGGLSLDEQADEYGEELWNEDPDQCCFLRKVKPLQAYLSDKAAWITAIRRDQSPTRADTQFFEWNETHEVVKVNPLADWTEDDIWNHIEERGLPYNPLHEEGYPSIGCIPCTEPVENGEDQRAGRWSDSDKTECGIHLDPESERFDREPEPAESRG